MDSLDFALNTLGMIIVVAINGARRVLNHAKMKWWYSFYIAAVVEWLITIGGWESPSIACE